MQHLTPANLRDLLRVQGIVGPIGLGLGVGHLRLGKE